MEPKHYRPSLIENNEKIIGIDYNIVTNYEKFHPEKSELPMYSELKWPIVEITNHLEHEEDYLNLFKAEIFVINNVYKRTLKIE